MLDIYFPYSVSGYTEMQGIPLHSSRRDIKVVVNRERYGSYASIRHVNCLYTTAMHFPNMLRQNHFMSVKNSLTRLPGEHSQPEISTHD